ncbi:MAG: type II toxin-antitoxin system prevent-host-death family antitoxin [Chloroflexi bacterium]|nr:type II toxin-antitoxin system prevent-host-death family antitoxin [Chloroflexota bacterium]
MSIPEIVSVAKLKAHLSEILKEVGEGKVYEVINRSEPVAMLLSVERFKALLEKIEDLEDAIFLYQDQLEDYEKACGPRKEVMAKYWAEHPEEAPITLEEFKARYLAEHPDALAD